MIVILSGITGAGKSYLKKHIISKLNFKNIVIVTTRAKRTGEVEGVDKHFVTEEEFELLKNSGEISVPFEFLGHKYAYYTRDLLSDENGVTELHYSTIDEFKKVAKEVVSIYIQPNVDMAKKQLKLRCLPKAIEKFRLKEIKEQIKEFENNIKIREKFDYIIPNDYTDESLDEAVNLIKNIEERRYVSA
ncbi:MAG: hypothetical protein IKD76_01715 [Clostridia bacterium]|nr:hypothetical protein [Clostridia bacterium]